MKPALLLLGYWIVGCVLVGVAEQRAQAFDANLRSLIMIATWPRAFGGALEKAGAKP